VSERQDEQTRRVDAAGMVDPSRDGPRLLAEHQAALRRVATRSRFLRKSNADDLRL
jgi:hypothetical protein